MDNKIIILLMGLIGFQLMAFSQTLTKIAVLTIDSKGLETDPVSLGSLARIEL